MEEFLIHLPNTPIGWLSLFFAGVISTLAIISRVRSNDMKTLREFNEDLIKRDEERVKELKEMHLEIEKLKESVLNLEKANKTLQDLVVTALKQYFFENPTVAGQMQKAVMKT